MGVTSVRFNDKDEKAIKVLTSFYHLDLSTIIKKALWGMYEDMKDLDSIENFEKKNSKKKVKFHSAKDILK